ncbi:drug resistance transporter, Bcr/CflA subfamily [Dickeya parazeae Ech586]|uniref:Bcr/CflA family efflux transporter n=1 Tax=Dickeya zeae (strain Ech586) TaxID=590409 RepID=D2BTM0_DICZ5|nr:multidrug effflux MFS transporter [Dickeya parazeae]ACZ77851.1 drug resistance transporter, Bcr/CflA subfamily [Dickeya parazeae Ech586]
MIKVGKENLGRIAGLFPLVVAAPLGLDICLPGVPSMSHELGSMPGMTQWIISGFVLCLSLSQLFFGPLVDRVGAQRVLLGGCVVYALSALGVYLTSTISGFIALRLVQGCGAGAMAVAASASVPLRFQGAAIGKVFSLLNGVISLVPVLAPVIGGVLIVHYGWRSSFYALGLFALLCGMLVLWKPLPAVCCGTSEGKGRLSSAAPLNVFSGYLTVFRHPEFRLGCFAASFGFATQLIFFSSSPIVLIETLHIPVDQFGYYFAVNALAITTGSLLTARLLGRVKETVILHGGAVLILLAMAGFILTMHVLTVSVWPYLISATLGSLGFAVLIATGASIALSPFKSLAGQASALMAAIQMSFSSLVAWGVMNHWRDDWSPMIAAYFLLAVALLVQLQAHRLTRIRRHQPEPAVFEKSSPNSD